MTVEDYQELTGITVEQSDEPRVEAMIAKSIAKLGSLLGYPLTNPKRWSELGKFSECGHVPFPSLPVGDDVLSNLKPADQAKGQIRLFNLDELDKHIRITPAKEVYRVKIVLPVKENQFITISELENGTPYLNQAGHIVGITRYRSWFAWRWWSRLAVADKSRLMLAVDAKFVDPLSSRDCPELVYLFTDMVTYYSDPTYSIMGNIRSESIDSHSYTRASVGTNADNSAPEGRESGKAIIAQYAGPGAFRNLVR